MTAKEVFSKTLVFGWIKLGLGLLNILIAIVLFAILMGISVLFASEGVGAIMFFIWLVAIGVVNFIINHYIGYLVKAGHVAIIATAFKTGTVLADPVNTGKAMVKERFRKGQDGPNEVKKAYFCPSCGTSLSPDTAFCGNCGMRLKEI